MVFLEYAWVGAWERKVLWAALCIVYWGLGKNVNICSPKIPIMSVSERRLEMTSGARCTGKEVAMLVDELHFQEIDPFHLRKWKYVHSGIPNLFPHDMTRSRLGRNRGANSSKSGLAWSFNIYFVRAKGTTGQILNHTTHQKSKVQKRRPWPLLG